MPPEKFKSYIKTIEKPKETPEEKAKKAKATASLANLKSSVDDDGSKDKQKDSEKERIKKENAKETLANIELLKKYKSKPGKLLISSKPKDQKKEKIKREKAKETQANIEAMKTLEDQELLAKLNRDFKDIDELIKNTKDEGMKQTLTGLKLALEEAKNPTEIKKFLDEIKKAGIKKLL